MIIIRMGGIRERSDIKLWLKDAALFDVIEKIPELRGVDWWDWPIGLRDREKGELLKLSEEYSYQLDEFCVVQFFGIDSGSR